MTVAQSIEHWHDDQSSPSLLTGFCQHMAEKTEL